MDRPPKATILSKGSLPGSINFSALKLSNGQTLDEAVAILSEYCSQIGLRSIFCFVAPNHDMGVMGHFTDRRELSEAFIGFAKFVLENAQNEDVPPADGKGTNA